MKNKIDSVFSEVYVFIFSVVALFIIINTALYFSRLGKATKSFANEVTPQGIVIKPNQSKESVRH